MSTQIYDKARTALLFIDPYNDFLSEGGKLWPRVKDVATDVGLLDNLRAVNSAARRAGISLHRSASPMGAGRLRDPGATQARASNPS